MQPLAIISPQDQGLPVAPATSEKPIPDLGLSPAELDRRIRANTYEWLARQFDEEVGAFYGYYSASQQRFDKPQTTNLIGPWQLLAAHDRYQDERLLTMARRAAEWFFEHFCVSHPMSTVRGGIRDTLRMEELWTKYAAEFVILNIGLHRRTGQEVYLQRARQSGIFLIESGRHNFAPRYNRQSREWEQTGWQSFGRVIEALAELARDTQETLWRDHMLHWAEHALSLQAEGGGFYLINGEYANTDLVADELRALLFLSQETGREAFLQAARRYADWLLQRQRADGAWPLAINRDGIIVSDAVGPGDIPNIAAVLLGLARATGEDRYRKAAMLAFRYGLSTQAIPGSHHPYLDDPRVQWGFWSWDPYYDYTLSADQSTHHVRGLIFLLDLLPQWPALSPRATGKG